MNRKYILYLCTTLLAACAPPGPPAPVGVKPDVRPDADAAAAVAAIREAGARFDSSVEVHPLRNPAVDGLVQQARAFEAQQQLAQAIDAMARALKIAPDSPDLLQYQAELLIESGDWQSGAAYAQSSYERGPKVGALCARSLQTLIEVHTVLKDDARVAQARQQMLGCRVPAPARF
jgi:Tfp pilus assembly protein PilF